MKGVCVLVSVLFAVAILPAAGLADSGPGGGGGSGGDGSSGRGGDDGGGGENRYDIRASGRCTAGAWARLRLRARDGSIEVRFDVGRARSGSLWNVVVTHERTVAARTRVRASSSGRFHVDRVVRDYGGADAVSVRATGPRGESCWATLVGS